MIGEWISPLICIDGNRIPSIHIVGEYGVVIVIAAAIIGKKQVKIVR